MSDYSSDAAARLTVSVGGAWPPRLSAQADGPVDSHLPGFHDRGRGSPHRRGRQLRRVGGNPQHLLQRQVLRRGLPPGPLRPVAQHPDPADLGAGRRRLCDFARGRAHAGRSRVLPDPLPCGRVHGYFPRCPLPGRPLPDRLRHPRAQPDDAHPDRVPGHGRADPHVLLVRRRGAARRPGLRPPLPALRGPARWAYPTGRRCA